MASFLIAPPDAGPWRADTDALGTWLAGTWRAGHEEGTGSGHQARLWSLPDPSQVWVPEDRDVVWADAPGEVLASLAGARVGPRSRSSSPTRDTATRSR